MLRKSAEGNMAWAFVRKIELPSPNSIPATHLAVSVASLSLSLSLSLSAAIGRIYYSYCRGYYSTIITIDILTSDEIPTHRIIVLWKIEYEIYELVARLTFHQI